jgi:hypothetical protein
MHGLSPQVPGRKKVSETFFAERYPGSGGRWQKRFLTPYFLAIFNRGVVYHKSILRAALRPDLFPPGLPADARIGGTRDPKKGWIFSAID